MFETPTSMLEEEEEEEVVVVVEEVEEEEWATAGAETGAGDERRWGR